MSSSSGGPPARRRAAIASLLVLSSFLLAALASQVEPGALFDRDGAKTAWSLLAGLASPDLSPDVLTRVGRLAVESLLIGVLGTALAAAFGVVMALACTRVPNLPDPPRVARARRLLADGVRFAVRFVLGVCRAIPDIVWAFLFVRLVGLGPGAAVLAIAVYAGGIIGKMFAELAEAVDPGPIHALRRTGMGRLGLLVYGVLPQVRKQWIAYGLFRLECSIRSASILGVVGAGGLGSEIALSVRYFQFDKLATALLAVLALVLLMETVSHALRRVRFRWTLAATLAGSLAALATLDIPWSEIWRSRLLPEGVTVGGGEALARIARTALTLAAHTVAMAWCATLAAAAVAFLIAPLATRTLRGGSYLADPPRRRGLARILAACAIAGARAPFQVCRALPEVTLALVFVVWVGPGPFAGVLAITVHTAGVLHRLYSDVYEEVERPPVAALEGGGAGRFAIWTYGVLPQVGPRILAFTLYRFDVNVRMTTTVGLVGAGGIGEAIDTAISLFHRTDLVGLLAVLLIVVTALDVVGDRLRHHILMARFQTRDARGRRSRRSRLTPFQPAPASAQEGDRDGLEETGTDDSGAGDRGRRPDGVRLREGGEDPAGESGRAWRVES